MYYYFLVLNLKSESPAKRGAKRKPTELVTNNNSFAILSINSSLARREGGSVRRGLLEQAALSSGRMEADEQLVGVLMSMIAVLIQCVCFALIGWKEAVYL